MKRRTMPVLTLLCALACGGVSEANSVDVAADEAAARALTSSFDAAVNAQDIEAMMARYADDAVRMDPNTPAAIGKEAIRALFLENWAANSVVVENRVSDVRVSGDLAATRGTYTVTVTPVDGGDPTQDMGKWSAALERQTDGSWKSIWEIWSSDLPPTSN